MFESHLLSLSQQDSHPHRHEQGIIFPCGGTRQLANAYVGLRVIRNYFSCNLPVEIAYYGVHEMDDYHRALFQVQALRTAKMSATCRRLPVSCLYEGSDTAGCQ